MIYSCFDDARGVYRYFQDGDNRPINADLPVPSFRSRTKIGVPAIEAGRPLPSAAQPIGEGWHARGMVVRCGSASSFSGLGAMPSSQVMWPLGAAGVGAAAGAMLYHKHPGIGAAVGAAAGATILVLAEKLLIAGWLVNQG